MIKLKNSQVMMFNSEVFKKFYNDSNRRFPISDAFKLEEILNLIESKVQLYNKLAEKLLKSYEGTKVDERGMLDLSQVVNRDAFLKELNELNETEVNIDAEPLEIKDNWPDLSMVEVTILKPIIKTKTDNNNENLEQN